LEWLEVDSYLSGLLRVLERVGIVSGAPGTSLKPVVLRGGNGDTDALTRCESSGLCVTRSKPGVVVAPGQVVADIFDEQATITERITAERRSSVMMIRRSADVAPGSGIVMFGPAPDGVP